MLPGVAITARHPDTGFVVERVTDDGGRFFLPALRVGTWEIKAEVAGFAPRTETVVLEIGRTLALDLTLGLAGLSEQVRVSGSAPLLQVTTAEISDVISNTEVVGIPLNGRNFLALAQLSDAVVLPPGGTRGEALQQAGPLPNVGGQRSGHNIYLLDGVKVTDELFNNLVINPSVDSIQEFKIQKSMYAPEFGGKASALINVATRSGANAFRGTLFEFLRDDAFDSPNYFRPVGEPVPPLRQNQFGGTLGGPIVRNRSFFFASFERLRMERSLTRAFSVPSMAERAGNFAGFAPICDPLTIPTTGVCTPFADNRIPDGRIDPIARALLEHVSAPTSGGSLQNLTAVEEQDRDLDQFSLRLDHQLSDADSLLARFSTFDAAEIQPFGTSALQEALVPGFGRSLTTETRNLVLSHTRIFGSGMLNELRFGWMKVGGGQLSPNSGNPFAQQVGLLGVTTDPRDMGFPQISTSGRYSTFGDPTIFTTRDNQHFELFENFTIDRGAHRVKFGAYYFHLQLRPVQPDNARGAFTYTGQFSGNAFADFLLGYPGSAVSGIGRGDENGRTNWLHLYAQDDWQPRGNLTLNLGLRYEFNQHMYDVDNRLSSIDLATPGGRFVIASDDSGAIDPSGDPLLPLIPTSIRDHQPGRMEQRPDAAEHRAACAANRLRLVAQRLPRRDPGRVRHLPEPVGVQRADGVRPQPAVLLHETGRRAADRSCADARNRRYPGGQCDRDDRREHHGLRLRRRVQPDLEWRAPVRAAADDHGGSVLHGNVDAGRRQRDRSQRAGSWVRGRFRRAAPFRN